MRALVSCRGRLGVKINSLIVGWLRSCPKRVPKKGLLGIKNVLDAGRGTISSWVGGAARIVEEIENGRRYSCNDRAPDDDFDDIVFTITKAP